MNAMYGITSYRPENLTVIASVKPSWIYGFLYELKQFMMLAAMFFCWFIAMYSFSLIGG